MVWNISSSFNLFGTIIIIYQIILHNFSQEVFLPSDDDSRQTVVYSHNLMKSLPIRELESSTNEAVWLKLTHPDPIYDESIDDESSGIRVRTANHPITMGMISTIMNILLLVFKFKTKSTKKNLNSIINCDF